MSFASFDAQSTLGALLIGLFVSCSLFGVGTVQTYIYYTHFPKDKAYIKLMVIVVWFCELGHCICICHTCYVVAISGYGNPTAFLKLPNSVDVAITISGIIGTIVQVFFIERLHVVSGQLFIPIICWTLSVLRCVLSFVTTSEAMKESTIIMFDVKWKWLCALVLAVGATVDFFVAMYLSYYLKTQKSNGLKGTSFVIDKITAWTIQTGLLTSLTGLAMLICFLAMPKNLVWIGIFMFLVRMFSNSLLASLNGRAILRERDFFELQQGAKFSSSQIQAPSQIAVHVTTMTEIKIDPVYEHGIF